MNNLARKFLIFSFALALVSPTSLFAYSVADIDGSVGNDILITPAKVELALDQGESKSFQIKIANRLERTTNFAIEIVDLLPSSIEGEVLSIEENNKTAATSFLRPEITNFALDAGKEITLSINAAIPVSASSGGYSLGVLVSGTSQDSAASTVLKSRVGVVTLIRVGDEVIENGELVKFNTKNSKNLFFKNYIETIVSFENKGNVHLNPYGGVTVKNWFGNVIETHEVRPWFVLRDQTRTAALPLIETDWKFGKYTLLLELNRGYDNVIDRQEVSVYVFSYQWLLVGLILILALLGIWYRTKKMGDSPKRGTLFYIYIVVLLVALVMIIAFKANAERATSTNYILEKDSISIGGDNASSTTYLGEDTIGEVATGLGTSTTYILNAGYQQLDGSTLSISSPANITLSPAIDFSDGGQADGSASWLVTSSSLNGYSLTIKASQSPAMRLTTGSEGFADYTPAGSDPDYDWLVPASSYEFGYSPNGDDVTSRWKNDGANCDSGSTITNLKCWDGHSTTNVLIASAASSNYPTGESTTVNFRAESNEGSPTVGDYQATLTLTALAL